MSIDDTLRLREAGGWIWTLYRNQGYLGRVQLTLARTCHGSLAEADPAEWSALHGELALYRDVVAARFQPDRINIKQLGNVWPQLHVHIVPRYKRPPTWQGIAFPDIRWGDDPHPEFPSPIDAGQTAALAAELRAGLALA